MKTSPLLTDKDLLSSNEFGRPLISVINDLENDVEVALIQNETLFSKEHSKSKSGIDDVNFKENIKGILHQLLFKYIQKIQQT